MTSFSLCPLVSWLMVWDHTRADDPVKSRIILTNTNAEVHDLNVAARYKLRDPGELWHELDVKTERGERQYATGDRMMILRNERSMGVKNGTLGTVESVTPGHMEIEVADAALRPEIKHRLIALGFFVENG